MQYKSEIWHYFIRFADELRHKKFMKEQMNREVKAFFYAMEDETFYRLLNTFRWMTKYNDPYMWISESITKPTNTEILEALTLIHDQSTYLLVYAKKHPKGDVRSLLMKKTKRQLECVNYYRNLVEEDFFASKELIES